MENERLDAVQGRIEGLMHTVTALLTGLAKPTAAAAARDLEAALDIAIENQTDESATTRQCREELGRAYVALLRSVAARG